MSAWLDPVRRALDASTSSTLVFFRDDDAGLKDDELHCLLDLMLHWQVPIALAAIPMAVNAQLAAELRTLLRAHADVVSVHQHGYAHVNHQICGRRSEFGADRTRAQQRNDLANGRHHLQQVLGRVLPQMFTPPWNRCTRDTADCLVELGFHVLSRDRSAEPFGLDRLYELPVCLDWSGRHGAATGPARWAETIARAIGSERCVGLMLHHAVMTAVDRRMLDELLEVMTRHPHATIEPMADIAAAQISGDVRCRS